MSKAKKKDDATDLRGLDMRDTLDACIEAGRRIVLTRAADDEDGVAAIRTMFERTIAAFRFQTDDLRVREEHPMTVSGTPCTVLVLETRPGAEPLREMPAHAVRCWVHGYETAKYND